MPRNARAVAPGIPYHITQRGSNHQKVFFTIRDRKVYLQLIRENLEEAGVRILAYCLMTNHIHFVAVPAREDSLATLFGRANGRYSQALNIGRGRCGHLWQARFHSCPMSESHLAVALRYVETNPCRAGMARAPGEYRWSSAAAHLGSGVDPGGILDLRFWERAGGAPFWAELLGAAGSEAEMVELRECTYAGRPYGSQEFVEQMEARFQRRWLRKSQKSATAA